MAVLGFDFGTTNSLMSLVQGDRVLSFYDERGLPVPSIVCYEGGKTIVGREARERLSQAGLGVHDNIVRSPKGLLGREGVVVGGVERSPVDIVREVVSFVSRQVQTSRTVKGLSADRAVVTIPVNMDGYRRSLLRDACRMAGLSVVQFVHEPLAALYGYMRASMNFEEALRKYDRKLLMVFDWGGGTLDLTLCRATGGKLMQIGNDGTDEVGGDVFDEELRNEIERLVRMERSLGADVDVLPEARSRLMAECERAKIDLSTKEAVSLYVGSFFKDVDDPSLDFRLSRSALEAIVSKLVLKGIRRIESLLDREGYSPASVSMCLATGGMANMPIVQARLHELFGPERVHLSERSASLISEGAAWVAHDKAQLLLAKNVELVLARNSYMTLLPAGLRMPQERETQRDSFSLYCVDPTDGKGKFQLVTPHRPGTKASSMDARRPLANLVVHVDQKAAPFFERLRLDVEIDENLVLKASATSLNKKGNADTEIYDLEFALALAKPNDADEHAEEQSQLDSLKNEPGTLMLRSNIAAHENKAMVPGEVLYKHDSAYFDRRMNPPQIQDDERLYYSPCAICKRPSNDPLCRCASV